MLKHADYVGPNLSYLGKKLLLHQNKNYREFQNLLKFLIKIIKILLLLFVHIQAKITRIGLISLISMKISMLFMMIKVLVLGY